MQLSDLIGNKAPEIPALVADMKNEMEQLKKAVFHCNPQYLKDNLKLIHQYLDLDWSSRSTVYIDMMLKYLLLDIPSEYRQSLRQKINTGIEAAKNRVSEENGIPIYKGNSSDFLILCSYTDKEGEYEACIRFDDWVYKYFGLSQLMAKKVSWSDDFNIFHLPELVSDFPIKFYASCTPDNEKFSEILSEQILEHIYNTEFKNRDRMWSVYGVFCDYFRTFYDEENVLLLKNDRLFIRDSLLHYQEQLPAFRQMINESLRDYKIPEKVLEELAQKIAADKDNLLSKHNQNP